MRDSIEEAQFETIKNILIEVLKECSSQEEYWGIQNHHPEKWMNILMEEVGEASKAVLESFPFQGDQKESNKRYWISEYRDELIQVAAVAISAIDSLDRNEGKETKNGK